MKPLQVLASLAFAPAIARAQPAAPSLSTTLQSSDIDAANSAQSLGGQISPVPDVARAFYLADKRPEWDGVRWGAGKALGARRMRVAFKRAVEVGSVLARGGGVLSVLKPGAVGPGDIDDDAQWIPAQRISKGALPNSTAQGEDFALWLLPPGTRTRALRWTHNPRSTEANFEAWLGGAIVLGARLVNVAPWGTATVEHRTEAAARLNNESNDGVWQAWNNGDEGAPQVLTAANPERITLAWPSKVSLSGLALLGHGFGAATVQIYVGPDSKHPREAAESDWQNITSRDDLQAPYPLSLGVEWMDFGRQVSTRAIRLLVTKTSVEAHPHLGGNTKNGKRTWLSEIMALSPVGASASQVLGPLRAAPQAAQPPIPIRFSVPEDGLVTLVIEDAQGRRVRNLISETPFKKGARVVGWDGTDDTERDREAARHGVFHIPSRFVAPGQYTVRGLWHRPLGLSYEFSVYASGSPPWETADKSGGWLTNHTPPSSAIFVPASQSPDGKDTIYLGAFVSEGGAGLAWTDLEGRKKGGRGWIGGNWTGAAYLARDEGAARLPNIALYAASPWSVEGEADRSKPKRGEIRITGVSKAGDVEVIKYGFEAVLKDPLLSTGDADWAAQMGGLAVRDGLIAVSMPTLNRVLFIDAALNRVRASAQVLEPRGLAFDSAGRLLVASQSKMLRFELPPALRPARSLDRAAWKATSSRRSEEAGKAIDGDSESRWDTGGSQAKGTEFQLDLGAAQKFSALKLRSNSNRDSPRALQLLVSDEGQNWREVFNGVAPPEWKASGNSVVSFAPQSARFVKLVLQADLAADDEGYWSINDLLLLDAPAPPESVELSAPQVLAAGLDEPQQIALAGDGRIFVSQWGESHNVQVLAADGKKIGAVGAKGKPVAGPYNTARMNRPKGLSVDSRGRLWVAEEDFQPKRVSVWNVGNPNAAALWKAFYGPSRYGGGGTLDGHDPSRFYYDGMEFALDWKTGRDRIVSIFHRPRPGELGVPDGYGSGGTPEFPISLGGHKYFTNCYNSNPTNGSSIAMIWKRDAQGIARPIAAAGRANEWSRLKADEMRSRWPQGADLKADYNASDGANRTAFVWADQNGDAQMQPAEISMVRAEVGGMTVAGDLSFVFSRLDREAKGELSEKSAVARLKPVVSKAGVPKYNWSALQVLATGAQRPVTSGGDQALLGTSGWVVSTIGLKPFAAESISGAKNGRVMWQYPSLWPGLHASHEAPKPELPGQVIGTTRVLGPPISVKTGDAAGAAGAAQSETLFFVNGNMGNIYAWTQDGLFVGQLFSDIRQGPNWAMPIAQRNMKLNGVSLHDENFWPSVARTGDNKVFLVDGGRSSLVRVDGLDSIRRLPAQPLQVSKDDLSRAAAFALRAEEERQKALGTNSLLVPILVQAPNVDGELSEWSGMAGAWAAIDKSGVAANFNSDSKPFDIEGRVAISDGKLFAAWKTGDVNWLRNSGEVALAPFKTGGALDLMISTDADADPNRAKPVAGDSRLLITQVAGKTRAPLYRAVVAGTQKPVPFSSPWRTVTLDRVDDVSDQVLLAGKDGSFEISVPLQVLGLQAREGTSVSGDIGVLRGNGFQTLARLYWSNKATAITADVPSEAELTPRLWGRWTFSK